ncbi:MAG: DUF373 family protein [archaeon]
MANPKAVLIICIDVDDDLGKKAGVKGPVIGRQANLNAGAKLAVKDPEDSDCNSIFAAIKKYDELAKYYPEREIVTLTGHPSKGFEADKAINEQLDQVLEKFPADAFVLVTDGASDDQVIPILQSRAKIISKTMVIVKQAKEMESAYYAIRQALRDPYLARLVFGIPGIILLLLFALPNIGLQIILLIAGIYLIVKGFGIEERVYAGYRSLAKSMSIQRISFPFYLGAIFIFAFGIISSYTSYYTSGLKDISLRIAFAAQGAYLFLALASIAFVIAKAIDCILLKKAYLLRTYVLSFVSVLLVWFMLDSATKVFAGNADLNYFLITIIASFAVLLVTLRTSRVFDIRGKVTKLLVGLPVYGTDGKWVGKVEKVSEKGDSIEYSDAKGKQGVKIGKEKFSLKAGKIVINP